VNLLKKGAKKGKQINKDKLEKMQQTKKWTQMAQKL
jgi:hypothetical protein